jgi:hypothetical protein
MYDFARVEKDYPSEGDGNILENQKLSPISQN